MARLEPRPGRVVGGGAPGNVGPVLPWTAGIPPTRVEIPPAAPPGSWPRDEASPGQGAAALPNDAQSAYSRNRGLFLFYVAVAFLTAASEIYRRSPKY